MIIQLFNSSSVSGPEKLVLPAVANFCDDVAIVNLAEERIERMRRADPIKDYSRSFNLPYHSVTVRSRWDRVAIGSLQRLLDQLHPDLVHVHSVKGATYLLRAIPAGQSHHYPILSTHHGVHGLPDLKTRLYEWFYRKRVLKSYDRVLCVSTADYEDVLRSGISWDRLRLHVNGKDGRRVAIADRPKEAQSVRAQWLPDEARRDALFIFGVVGRLSQEKDHARLLRVLSDLNRLPCERDWRCLIFGLGALEDKLRRQARELDLAQRVVWMGYREDVGDEMAGLDLLLSFSKAEGLPINLIEAGWAGTPVMSTWVGGVRDLIPDDRYGVRVLPDEPSAETAHQLQALLAKKTDDQRKALGARFQERVMNEFSQKTWIRRLEEIYAELNVRFKKTDKSQGSKCR